MILSIREGLRSFYYRLVRRKLLQQHGYGQPTWASRLLYLGPLYGLIFSTPAIAIVFWYSGLAVSAHIRHNTGSKLKEPLTWELFQLHLHDRLSADFRRLTMPEAQSKSDLPTIGVRLNNDKLSQLERMIPPTEGTGYVSAVMQQKNKLYQVEMRYRGAKPWHWNYPQKSWKVRVEPKSLMFEGLPTFNFINTPDPMPFNEQMVLDTARELGLVTPAYYPFRLLINNGYLGVYFFEGQADEGLLRQSRRAPGSIYSAAATTFNPETRTSSLWESVRNWKKVAATNEKSLLDMKELEVLLKVVQSGNFREFSDFAEESLDLDKFAALDALDVIFGNSQHDYHQNHKLYFDPDKHRFEPIATDFRDMEHAREFNRTENPLLLRLKELPAYLTLRNRKVYELLRASCSESALLQRVSHWMKLLEGDLARDPYWDAYELLPSMGTYYRKLVRPMNEGRASAAARVRLAELGERFAYLRSEIERQEIRARLYASPSSRSSSLPTEPSKAKTKSDPEKPLLREAILDISLVGQVGFQFTSFGPELDRDCSPREWELHADRNLDQVFVDGEDLRLAAVEAPMRTAKLDTTLLPGVRLEARPANPYRGRVAAVAEERSYRFFLRARDCMPKHWRLEGQNAATMKATTVTVSLESSEPPSQRIDCDERPGFIEAERHSPHPYCIPFTIEETVRLGPGVVDIDTTRVYRGNQTVIIEPGTTLRLATDASFISYGRVLAEGQPNAPIRFVPQATSFGGVALKGALTKGSRFIHVEFERGTKPVYGIGDFPGMVNLHDTRDIRLEHVRFSKNRDSDDLLHVAYVDELVVVGSRFEQAFGDALDLDYSTAIVEAVTVVGPGDDGLESTGSRVEVSDSRVIGCKKSAVSAGERSDLLVSRSLLAQSATGLLVRHASTASCRDTLIYESEVAVRQESEADFYPGESRVSVDATVALRAKTLFEGSKKRLTGSLPTTIGADDLSQLRQSLFGDGDFGELPAKLVELSAGREP